MKARLALSSLALSLAAMAANTAQAQCFGNVYSINGGRGDVGFLLDLKEDNKLLGYSNPGDRALISSRAAFSSSAMAYDPTTNRTYYVSVPRPADYHVADASAHVSSDEFNSLSLHASTSLPNQLAYFDHDAQRHTVVANVPATLRMAYDAANSKLIASNATKLFSIDPLSGAVSDTKAFDNNIAFGGFSSWGDFVFKDNALLYVTNTRTFSVDPSTAEMTLKSFHNIDFVTAATLDQNGQILVAAKNQNVSGNINSTWLYRVDPVTGEQVRIGLFPARVNAMSTNTQEEHTCYTATTFPNAQQTRVKKITNPTVEEGETASLNVSFNNQTKLSQTATLKLVNGTTKDSDYSRDVKILFSDGSSVQETITSAGTDIAVPAGVASFNVNIDTVDDKRGEESETATLKASMLANGNDRKTGTLTITDNDVFTENSICSQYSYVSVSVYGHTIYIDCDNGVIGGPDLVTKLNMNYQGSGLINEWETVTEGKGSNVDWRSNVGVAITSGITSFIYTNAANDNAFKVCQTNPNGHYYSVLQGGIILDSSTNKVHCNIVVNEGKCLNGAKQPIVYLGKSSFEACDFIE
ncbi:hypothetical protein A1OO_15850 [Enterovibrio norvegicus FF-33]|uniref:hypothetical protein n=1 Tax=Enterovibrio norvegicus TaxID=188144 RepID=UPI0002FDE318|nr:hypothetical protein [Enterovibrio norvegicus]OEE67230.1 hypothetical protein A1OO_15850 [Enterovibrio norvegicus FF-33]